LITPTNDPQENDPAGFDPEKTYHIDVSIAEKVCVVTGGGQARGKAIAEALARAGAKTVAITYSDDRDTAHEVYVNIQTLGSGCLLAHMDVTDRKSVRQVFVWIQSQVGKIDVLVNAEEADWPDDIAAATAGECLQAVGVNIHGPALAADEVLPFMGIQKTGGLIVGVAIEDEVTAALKTFDEPGVPASVSAAIMPMTGLASSRQVTMRVLSSGAPDEVAEAVVGLATA
jgi:NAD(P)-dependent dehydrogenase (short-subunit alcohol dehydrogenase family)